MGETYEDMAGPALAAELARRELPVSGRVDELRARLREDDEKRAQEDIQKLTDRHVAEIDQVLAAKEKEIMQV